MDDVTRGRIEPFDSSAPWFVAKCDDVAHVEKAPKKKVTPTP